LKLALDRERQVARFANAKNVDAPVLRDDRLPDLDFSVYVQMATAETLGNI
jgi:hypothetical protein